MKEIRLTACQAYGAWELKATYQRNMLCAMAVMIGFVTVLTCSLWLYGQLVEPEVGPTIVLKPTVEIAAFIDNPPFVRPDSDPFPAPARPAAVDLPPLVIPVPVADEMLDDEPELTLPDNLERAAQVDAQYGDGPPVGDDPGELGLPGFGGRGDGSQPGLHPDSFQILEVYPQMITEQKPKYPEIARRLGLEGSVWLQVLIDTEGGVVKAEILKTSGIGMLDDAALAAAWKNRFSPGLQGNRAVACWVKYQVKFVLSE